MTEHISHQTRDGRNGMFIFRRALRLLCLCMIMPVRAHGLSVEWDANTEPDLSGYKIYSATYTLQMSTTAAAAAPGVTILTINDPAASSYTLSGLSSNTPYYFRLTAFNAGGLQSDFSGEAFAYIDTSSPTVPAGLSISRVSSSAFTLGWTASTDNAAVTGYRLDVSVDPGFASFVTGYNNLDIGNISSKSITGLALDTLYYARLRAYDPAGNASADSASASTTTVLDISPPSIPSGLIPLAVSYSRIDLTWTVSDDNVGVTGYGIYRNGTLIGAASDPAYSDTGLFPSTAYAYAVFAYDAQGNSSGLTPQVSAATLIAKPPNPPGSVPPVIFGPNPFRPSRDPGSVVTFRDLSPGTRVRIFTNTGALIFDKTAGADRQVVWAGKNREFTPVASGIYMALVENGGDKKMLRLAVER